MLIMCNYVCFFALCLQARASRESASGASGALKALLEASAAGKSFTIAYPSVDTKKVLLDRFAVAHLHAWWAHIIYNEVSSFDAGKRGHIVT